MRIVARCALALAAVGAVAGPATAAVGVPVAQPVARAASSSAAAGSVTPKVTVAAWFQTDPLCSTPLGCGAIPLPALSPYPKGTYHVGMALGRQTARAYIGAKLGKVAQTASGGTLSIPLDTNPADGSIAPSAAAINVCVIYQKVTEVEGGFDGAPSPNCLPAAHAKYVAKPAPHLVADLGRLAGKLAGVKGFALLPAVASSGVAAAASAWQVVFRLPTDKPAALPHLRLLIAAPDDGHGVPHHHHPVIAPSVGEGDVGDGDGPPTVGPPPTLPPAITTTSPVAPTPVIAPRSLGHYVTVGYQYPEVWLLPILLAVMIPFTVRALTKDLARRQ